MAAFFYYASFPNSRIKPRSATSAAFTYQSNVSNATLPASLIISANENRTYATFTNTDPLVPLIYVYADPIVVDPSVVPTFGLALQIVTNVITGLFYRKGTTGLGTDWFLIGTDLRTSGEIIEPLTSVTLESPQNIWMQSNSLVAPPILVGVDFGAG